MLISVIAMIFVARSGYGAVGVALTLAVTIFLGYVFFFWPFFLRLINIGTAEFLRQVVVPGVLPAVAGSVVWILLKMVVTIDNWGVLFLCSVAGGTVYLAVLFGACLSATDKADLSGVLGRIRARQ